MDRLIKESLASGNKAISHAFDQKIDTCNREAFVGLATFARIIRSHVISFCVPFNSAKDDGDQDNYYMEREWRVNGEVRFELDDVCRVILPSLYAKRFRDDMPEYFGPVTFA